MDAVGERIKQRAENVAQMAEQRRALKDTNASSEETIGFFYDNFLPMKESLEKNIETAKTEKPENLSETFDSLHEEMQAMQQFLNESSRFLPLYNIKMAQEHINNFGSSIEACMHELNPKKKFGFSAKKPTEDKKKVLAEDSCDSQLAAEKKSTLDDILMHNFFGFRDHSDCELMKLESELKDRQFALHNLKNSKVIALGNPSSLQFSELCNCTVIVGPTSRSAFIKNCRDCTFIIACQQVRVHKTHSSHFYLHVTGAAIIEDCKDLHFAQYNLNYPNLDEHYLQSGLDLKINNWSEVQDFNWLNEKEKSPNFCLISPDDAQKDWIKVDRDPRGSPTEEFS